MILEAFVLAAAMSAHGNDLSTVAAPAGRNGVPAGRPVAEGGNFSAFRAIGVRDAATAATVVTCTNFGTSTRDLFVDVSGNDGLADCSSSFSLPAGQSYTFATRDTALYVEDDTCAVAPATAQGSLLISLSAWTKLICSVQVVDPAGNPPAYLERLALFKGDGTYLGFVIFASDFELGTSSSWSSTVDGVL